MIWLEVSNYCAAMEKELANHLLTLGATYGACMSLQESTVGRLCASDARFFSRIRDGKTFTVKKFDDVVCWFSDCWPDGVDWPDCVKRPVLTVTE